MMVADKLTELLHPSSATDTKLPKLTLEALHHFHKGPAFATESQTPVRIVMGKMVQLAFEVSLFILHLLPTIAIPQQTLQKVPITSLMQHATSKLTPKPPQTPFLMHAIIGAATTHLCTLLPENKDYRLAEAYHWQQTINQYSTEVSKKITHSNMDKLYSTCLMISMHSFYQETFSPRTSFVFTKDPTSLTWLRLQSGLRYLLERTTPWLPQSMWWTVFMESRDPSLDYEDKRPGRVDLDPDLADLCGIGDQTTIEENPYLWPLRMLMALLPFERVTGSSKFYNTWMGRLENPFYECLIRKETPALVLLAWWLGLMCYVEEWWVEMRVRSECTAICMFLEDSCDPLVLRLLEFPASCCGYLLRHEQERVKVLELDDVGFG